MLQGLIARGKWVLQMQCRKIKPVEITWLRAGGVNEKA